MKNLIVKTTNIIEGTTIVPEYFRLNQSQFYKIVSEKTYVLVSYYGTTKEQMEGLLIYPSIEVKMVDHLYIYIQGKDLVVISKEELIENFDACTSFIVQL